MAREKLEAHRDEVIRLYVEGQVSTNRLALQFGVNKRIVSVWLKEQGVQIRSKAERDALTSVNSRKPKSPEHRAKLAARDISYLHDPEPVAKMAKTKKGQPQPHLNTPESIAKRTATYNLKRSEVMKKNWEDPAYREKMSKSRSEQAKKRWAEGNWRNSTRNSKIEYEFAPFLAQWGLIHNTDGGIVITSGRKSRVPDFYNLATKQVVEVWGRYWHEGEDPKVLQQWYRRRGWTCSVVWEDEVLGVVEAGERSK